MALEKPSEGIDPHEYYRRTIQTFQESVSIFERDKQKMTDPAEKIAAEKKIRACQTHLALIQEYIDLLESWIKDWPNYLPNDQKTKREVLQNLQNFRSWKATFQGLLTQFQGAKPEASRAATPAAGKKPVSKPAKSRAPEPQRERPNTNAYYETTKQALDASFQSFEQDERKMADSSIPLEKRISACQTHQSTLAENIVLLEGWLRDWPAYLPKKNDPTVREIQQYLGKLRKWKTRFAELERGLQVLRSPKSGGAASKKPSPVPPVAKPPEQTRPKPPEPPQPERAGRTPERLAEWRNNIHFTIDDGPHPNDKEIAQKAVEKGAKVTFFWLGENIFTGAAREKLRRIPAGTLFQSTEYFQENWLRANIDPAKVAIMREVFRLARAHPQNISIGYHGMFHPHSWNTQIGGDAYDASSRKTGTKIRQKSQHYLVQQGQQFIEDDLRFFEKIVRVAINDSSYQVRQVRLPGTNASKAQSSGYVTKLPAGITYTGWDFDSEDSNGVTITADRLRSMRGSILFHSSSRFLRNIFDQLAAEAPSSHGDSIIQNPHILDDIVENLPSWIVEKDICTGFLDIVDRKLGRTPPLFDLLNPSDQGEKNAWRLSSTDNMQRIHLGQLTKISGTTIDHSLSVDGSEWYEALTKSSGRRYISFLYVHSKWKETIARDYRANGSRKVTPNSHMAEILGSKNFSVRVATQTDLKRFFEEHLAGQGTRHPHIDTLLPSIFPYLHVTVDGKPISTFQNLSLNSGAVVSWNDSMIMDFYHEQKTINGKKELVPTARVIPLSTMLLDQRFVPVEIFKVKDEAGKPPQEKPKPDVETVPQSAQVKQYLQEKIRESIGISYDSLDCQTFLESLFINLQDERIQKYFHVLQVNASDKRTKAIRNGEIITAILSGEIPTENITLDGLYDFLVSKLLDAKERKFSHMSRSIIGQDQDETWAKARIKEDLKQQVEIGEYAIMSYSFVGGGHTGLVLRTGPDTFVYYNSGIIESDRRMGVGAEDLDRELSFLFQRTRGNIEWVNDYAAYFHYSGAHAGQLVAPDGRVVGTCQKRGTDYYFNGRKINLQSSLQKKPLSVSIGKVAFTSGKIPEDLGDSIAAREQRENGIIRTVLSQTISDAHTVENWTPNIFKAMRESGMKVTENNVKYLAVLLLYESSMRHNPRKSHTDMTAEERNRYTYGAYELEHLPWAARQYIDTFHHPLERQIIEDYKKCDTDLDFYHWAQKALKILQDNPDIFANAKGANALLKLDYVKKRLERAAVRIDDGDNLRQVGLKIFAKKPSTFGAFEVNADIVLSRMNADIAAVQRDPEFRKIVVNGKVSRDLLVRTLAQDPSLPPANKMNEAAALRIAMQYYVRPNIYANAPSGELSSADAQFAFLDHHLGTAACRNAAIQDKLNQILSSSLALDGDLVLYDGLEISPTVSNTQKAVESFIRQYMPEWAGSEAQKARDICALLSEKKDLLKAIHSTNRPPASIFLQRLDEVCARRKITARNFIIPQVRASFGPAAHYSAKCMRKFQSLRV